MTNPTTDRLKAEFKDICKHCRGKGYATEFSGVIGYEDFGGEGFELPPKTNIIYCECSRGKQLKGVVETVRAEAGEKGFNDGERSLAKAILRREHIYPNDPVGTWKHILIMCRSIASLSTSQETNHE